MRAVTQEKWQAFIQQQSKSGLTITQFCKVNSISPTCFFKYRKILQATVIADTRTAFVKIQPPKASSSCNTIKIQYQDSTLSLPTTIEPVWIASLLKALV